MRWGAFVFDHRRVVLAVALVIGAVGGLASGRTSGVLSAGGWLDPGSESQAVANRLATEFGQGRSSLVLVYLGPAGADAASPEFQSQVAASLRGLRGDTHVTEIVGYAETADRRFIATDGAACYVVVGLDATDEASVPLLGELESRIAPPGAGIRLAISSYATFTRDTEAQSERDLLAAERISLPIAALVLLLVFGSLVAASLPLLVAMLAVPTTLGLTWLVGQHVQLSVYTQNITSMLGLALSIDYSLFLVSRFREELRAGRDTREAVAIAVATAGKAVTFSAMAVAVGLSGLLVFRAPALRSFGIGGALTVVASLFFALTLLPAVLSLIGRRIDRLSIGGLAARVRSRAGLRPSAPRVSRWARVAAAVMAHPIRVLVPTLALLLALGVPFLSLDQGLPGAATLPRGVESRDAMDALLTRFRPGSTMPIDLLVTVPGDPASAANVRALADYAGRVARVAGVNGVEGPFSGLADPATGRPLTADQLVALYAQPRSAWPPALAALWARDVRGSDVWMSATSPILGTTPGGAAVIPLIRAVDPGPGAKSQVGGIAAISHDFLQSQADSTPLAVLVVLVAMATILFLSFGSATLPVKAILMTLLSLTASFGALVWVFQEGNLAGPLGFDSPGFTIAGIPVIMFCVVFGLSMDYEVLLLSRVQEAWRRTGDNRASVAEGLTRTAGVITGAAAIMISVFVAFSLAESLTVKSMGVGMSIAVFVDATIVRVLLVPATMRLLGRWNWWAPGPLARRATLDTHTELEEPQHEPATP